MPCQAWEFRIHHKDSKPLKDFDPSTIIFRKTILVAVRKIEKEKGKCKEATVANPGKK